MGFDKSEVKVGTYREVGVLVEGRIDEAERKVQQALGAAEAFKEHATGAKGLPTVLAHADDQLEKEIPDIETLKIVKTYIMRCIHSTQNQGAYYKNLELKARGELHAYEKVHDQLRDLSTVELRKVDKVLKAVESGKIETGEVGHPGPSLKARRQAEEQLELQAQAKAAAEKEAVKALSGSNGSRKTKTAKKKAIKLKVVKTPVVRAKQKAIKGGNGADSRS